jgi:CRISPR-associated protein Cas5d
MPFRLHVWGERACFTRPEMKAERVSYDVITPSAARGMLEAIHWKPAIRWIVTRLHVLKPIRFEAIRRNEVGARTKHPTADQMAGGDLTDLRTVAPEARQQRLTLALRDVAYVIEARFERNEAEWGERDTEAGHADIFARRARRGQCFHRPSLGLREFDAHFALIERDEDMPPCEMPEDQRDRDLGFMLHDLDYRDGRAVGSRFYRPEMRGGIIDVPPRGEVG